MFDAIPIGKGRTEITLASAAPYAARYVVEAARLRFARALVAGVSA